MVALGLWEDGIVPKGLVSAGVEVAASGKSGGERGCKEQYAEKHSGETVERDTKLPGSGETHTATTLDDNL